MRAPDEKVGAIAKCPRCGERIEVPDTLHGTSPASAPAPKKGNSLAVASLVLGVIAALICGSPSVGQLSVPVGSLGMVLGLIGLSKCLTRERSGLAPALIATGISVGSLVLATLISGRTSKNIPTSEPDEPWVTVPNIAHIGDVAVGVAPGIDFVPYEGASGDGTSTDPYLIAFVQVFNANSKRLVHFRTWRGRADSLIRDFATLTDNNGNIYRHISFGVFSHPAGTHVSGSIYPGEPATDLLVFERPLKSAKYLNLELPASNVGEQGVFRFRIPTSRILPKIYER
jgi:hypothetical protein